MLRKILSLLFVMLLLLPAAGAEDVSDENPFIGAWDVLYYIQDGKPMSPEEDTENPNRFIFSETEVEFHMDDESVSSANYERSGSTAAHGSVTYTLQHEDLIVGSAPDLSFLLVRIDPIMLNNPFIGTWELLCYKEGNTVEDAAEYAMKNGLAAGDAVMTFTFAADAVYDQNNENVGSCIYADGACTIYVNGMVGAICTISADGLLHMVNPEDEMMALICAREDETVPEEISRFFGTWKDIAVLTDTGLYTEQMPLALRGDDAPLFFGYEFSRAYMRQSFLDYDLGVIPLRLCTYAGGQCILSGPEGDVGFSIDENGLMTSVWPDGSVSWCIRVEEASAEVLSASARGLLSDVTVTVTREADGTITAITVDASGETEAIARPCTEDAFLSQFIGRAGPFGDIDMVSGATYTSRAVIEAVNSLYAAE